MARLRIPLFVLAFVALNVMAIGVIWANANRDLGHPQWIDAGSVDRLDQRGVTYVPTARTYVVSTPDGLIALYARSPQLGEPVRYCASSGWFEDAMHGSKFDGDGSYVFGPAPRGLDRFIVRIQAGEAYVDTTEVLLGPPRDRSQVERAIGPFCTPNG